MSEKLLLNDRRGNLIQGLYSATEFILALLRSNRDHSKMKNESVKESLEKSQNVPEEKFKIVKIKICIKKTHTFTLIAMNFVQEQLKTARKQFLHFAPLRSR